MGAVAVKAEKLINNNLYSCEWRNYGCFQRECWRHCGEEETVNEWCFSANITIAQLLTMLNNDESNEIIPSTQCYSNEDPCFECIGDCVNGG